jgi:Tfp pilus assembly protein PilN
VRPINLLPARYRPARASGDRPGIAYAAIGILAVLLVMAVLYVVTDNKITDANNKTAEANAEKAEADAKIGQLQAFGDFASLKVNREAAVKGVADVRFDYERLMREMALVLPKDTYLTSFSASAGGGTTTTGTGAGAVTASGPTVTVAGCAPSHPGVATAIVRLRKLHNVTDVELQSSNKAAASSSTTTTSTATCKTQFNATLTFNPESQTTVTQPVPARLGGGQ